MLLEKPDMNVEKLYEFVMSTLPGGEAQRLKTLHALYPHPDLCCR